MWLLDHQGSTDEEELEKKQVETEKEKATTDCT